MGHPLCLRDGQAKRASFARCTGNPVNPSLSVTPPGTGCRRAKDSLSAADRELRRPEAAFPHDSVIRTYAGNPQIGLPSTQASRDS